VGFEFHESKLREAGKAGILKSMKGRIDDLGGTMTITSGDGRGTEVEFMVPSVRKETS
jgi:signal transduction histidine kinase